MSCVGTSHHPNTCAHIIQVDELGFGEVTGDKRALRLFSNKNRSLNYYVQVSIGYVPKDLWGGGGGR